MAFEPKMFMCRLGHQFIVYCGRPGEMTSRGTPEHRMSGCDGCDMAVDAAFAYALGKPPSTESHAAPGD